MTGIKRLGSGITIGRVFGINIVLQWSLLIAAALVTMSVVSGPFGTLAGWSPSTVWLVALLAAFGLFVSIYLHELGHSLVAQHHNIVVQQISLFVLGGVAELAEEPRTWRAELWIAIAGPIVSLLLAAVLLVGGVFLAGDIATDSAEAFFASLSPSAALLIWLGNVNLILGLFNMVPAFPMDGGRVFRAIVWRIRGDDVVATRIAASVGRFLGMGFVVAGVAMVAGIAVPALGSGFRGLWLAFIGWYVCSMASASEHQTLLRARFRNVTLRQIMQRHFKQVAPEITLATLVDHFVFPFGQRTFPVVGDQGLVLGEVALADVSNVPRDQWPHRSVSSVMTPTNDLVVLSETDDCERALRLLAEHERNHLLVLNQRAACVGVLDREHVDRWARLHPSVA